ncbi:hypothetical protein CACET_c31530 [Clostridium aceticum]|uniref:Uncharacterized protein n=1 Tax=Clostridium aceticum TaxID=84022 RepID=A0A0D8I5G5_9CLOT|nr:hypothetical protein CACET_c31530 [Clostridium aceticum]KJF25478.1 hypothetical protein TZ02_18455 [Clostridium aceticum]
MPRKPRIHYKGALYHVMVRGNNREKVLQGEIQKKKGNNSSLTPYSNTIPITRGSTLTNQ